jgi:hypothetical protein
MIGADAQLCKSFRLSRAGRSRQTLHAAVGALIVPPDSAEAAEAVEPCFVDIRP